jgi:hypothetical protein
MKRIDFSASYLTWLTRKERSFGRFQLEAACTIRDFSREKTETYYLAPAVIAGTVYAKNDLVKQPVYLFQIAASQESHAIYRTFVSHVDDQSSIDKNSTQFDEVEFHITRKEATVIKDFDDIDFHFKRHNSMSAFISYETLQHYQIEIEFPIKHINIQRERKLFQVETGPILIPSEAPTDWLSEGQSCFFKTAFIHFNRLDRAEITFNVPTCIGQETICFFSQVKKLNTQIILMVDNDKREQSETQNNREHR